MGATSKIIGVLLDRARPEVGAGVGPGELGCGERAVAAAAASRGDMDIVAMADAAAAAACLLLLRNNQGDAVNDAAGDVPVAAGVVPDGENGGPGDAAAELVADCCSAEALVGHSSPFAAAAPPPVDVVDAINGRHAS